MNFSKYRMEQFSDGVMSIIVTIMVLNIPLPKTFGFKEIMSLLISVFVFFVSFFVVGFFWHQHYRLFHNIKEITSKASWRNLLFLFSLSLMPIFTKWVIENFGQVVPAIGYAIVFIFVNLSFQFMFSCVITDEEKNRFKEFGKFSWIFIAIWLIVIVGSIVLSVFQPLIASALLIGLPLIFSLCNLWFEHDQHVKRIR